LAVSLPALYLFQSGAVDRWIGWAFVPSDLERGRWVGLFTSMWLHGSWAHALMNAVGALTFAAPVARRLSGGAGLVAFFGLYLIAGLCGTLGYAALHWGSNVPLVGASGAVFGLIGASTRLMTTSRHVLPLTDPAVVRASLAWMGVNLLVGLIGFAPGVEGARVAWEAHAFGFLAGLLLIGPTIRFVQPTEQPFASRAEPRNPVD